MAEMVLQGLYSATELYLLSLLQHPRYLIKLHVLAQVGLEGERLSLHSLSGSSAVEWAQGSFVTRKQPLTWYKVSVLNLTQS